MPRNYEVPQIVGKVTVKAGTWRGKPMQFKEKIQDATQRAFGKARLEMINWINTKVPWKSTNLRQSGIMTIFKEAHKLFFPFEMHFGFPARARYTYKRGERKGQTVEYSYANFVNQMRERGARPRKPGTIAPFIEPGRYFLKRALEKALREELDEEFPQVQIEWIEQ